MADRALQLADEIKADLSRQPPDVKLEVSAAILEAQAWIANDEACDGSAEHVRLDAAAGGFDFGKFRHGLVEKLLSGVR